MNSEEFRKAAHASLDESKTPLLRVTGVSY